MICRDGECDLSIYPPSPGGCDDWDRREAVYPFILTTKSQGRERPSLRFLNRWGHLRLTPFTPFGDPWVQ